MEEDEVFLKAIAEWTKENGLPPPLKHTAKTEQEKEATAMRKKLEEDIAALEKQLDSLPTMTEEQKRITSETLKKNTEELKAIQSQRA